MIIGGLAVLLAAGCNAAIGGDEGMGEGDGDGSGDGSGGGGGGGGGGGAGPDGGGVQAGDDDADTVPDADDNCPFLANTDQADGDGDGFGNLCDCDAGSADVIGYKLVNDDLTADRGLFEVPTGFAAGSWTYSGGYRQSRLANDATDVSIIKVDHKIANVLIEVTAQSTEIADFNATDLRQIMFLARGDLSDQAYDAVGCGIEVVEGLSPTQKTSALKYATEPDGFTAIERTNRVALEVGVDFSMKMELSGTQMTCSATVGGETTTATGDVPEGAGAIALHTRETKALFKSLRVCELP
ncbi:MAG TPA: hypothetical protein VMZ28_16640 [Kofleriaceae bacterium]|nr:hypothetical protein [Kofleriaceae bacterium]